MGSHRETKLIAIDKQTNDGGVPDVDMRLLKFWRINNLETIASIFRTPPSCGMSE
jgi:hypothetical protein